jgi:hypothetical protein
MIRFTIRDVLWLTVVVGLSLGWWVWRRSQPTLSKAITGTISVGGKPLLAGRIYFYSKSRQFRGAGVANGEFQMEAMPLGEYRIIIEGDSVAALYSDLRSAPLTSISRRTKSMQFGLHSEEYLTQTAVGPSP